MGNSFYQMGQNNEMVPPSRNKRDTSSQQEKLFQIICRLITKTQLSSFRERLKYLTRSDYVLTDYSEYLRHKKYATN